MKHTIICGHVLDVLKTLPDESVDTVITSPPYWSLRSYLPDDHPDKAKEIGLEPTLDLYIEHLLDVMRELKRILKKTGVIFWNHGDCYGGTGTGHKSEHYPKGHKLRYKGKSAAEFYADTTKEGVKSKCMALQNERFIIRCIDELGFILRDRVIWTKRLWISKTNSTIGSSMPTSAKDRCSFSYEPVYVLTKSPRYYWDQDAIRTPLKAATKERVKHAFNPSKGDIQGAVKHTGAQHFAERVNQGELTGANRPNVWQINLEPTSFPHYAPFPSSLVSSCLLAGCPRYVCKKCGRPRQRITDKNYLPIRPGLNTGKGKSGTDSDPNKSLHQRDISRYRMQIQYKTLGWSDCGCNAGYDSGVVMDIFAGTGTVGVVAEQMGFNSIQIDLNKEYCEIAYQRLKPLVAQTKLGREPSVIERIGF